LRGANARKQSRIYLPFSKWIASLSLAMTVETKIPESIESVAANFEATGKQH
jgi:hypothetical protein